jgi:hypothetical protein
MNILECKLYIISPGINKYNKRIKECFSRLVDAGFKNIEFVRSIVHENKTQSLCMTTEWILKKELNNNQPFMIVDDDIQIENFEPIIDIPSDAAAIYLGICIWMYPFPYNTIGKGWNIYPIDSPFVQSYNDELTRIKGMTSSHAILFIDRSFTRLITDRLKNNIHPHDLILACTQREFSVYALKTPIFYQDSSLGGQELQTRIYWSKDYNKYIRKEK